MKKYLSLMSNGSFVTSNTPVMPPGATITLEVDPRDFVALELVLKNDDAKALLKHLLVQTRERTFTQARGTCSSVPGRPD